MRRKLRCKPCTQARDEEHRVWQQTHRPKSAPPDQCCVCKKVLYDDVVAQNQKDKRRGDRRCLGCAEQHASDAQREDADHKAQRIGA